MGCQETWEVLLLPVGEIAGEGMASVTNKDPGPLSGLHDDGHVETDPNLAGTHGPGWRSNKPKGKRSRKS